MLLHADNFSIYGTNTAFMLNGIYAQIDCTLVADPSGASGTVLKASLGANPATVSRYVWQNGAKTKGGVAFRLWMAALPASNNLILPISFADTGNTTLASLEVLTTGQMKVNITGGSTYTSTIPVVSANGWYHVEMSYTHGTGALCSFEVRVEGVSASGLLQTNVAGTNADPAQVTPINKTNAVSWYIKDLVVWDNSGTYNNDFLGSVMVTRLTTTSDISLNWTPSTGTTGYNILAASPPVDTTYISAPYNAGGPPYYPNAYVGDLSNVPATATTVKGVITFVRAAKSDGGDGSLQVGLISSPAASPATVLGANRPITTAQTYWRDVFETDPKTSVPWLPAAVNLAQLQINRTL